MPPRSSILAWLKQRWTNPRAAEVSCSEPDSRSNARTAASSGVRSDARPMDLDMMGRALELARLAGERGEVPVGAVVYRASPQGPEILGEGANTREREKDPAGHAEFLAIQAACERLGDWRLEGCTLVVTLEPCPMCAGLILNSRVPRVVYGAADPKAGAVASLFALLSDPRLNHRCDVVSGVRGEESAELLTGFFRRLRGKGPQMPNKERS